MDWQAWREEMRPGMAAVCRGEPDKFTGVTPRERSMASLSCILAAVHEVTRIPKRGIMGVARTKRVCTARRLAWTLATEEWPDRSIEYIAELFNRNRSTVLFALSKPEDNDFRMLCQRARAAL